MVFPFNHSCSGKATIITYPDYVPVPFRIQHAMRMRPIVICGLPASTIFFHIILKWQVFRKKNVAEHKMCVLIFSIKFV